MVFCHNSINLKYQNHPLVRSFFSIFFKSVFFCLISLFFCLKDLEWNLSSWFSFVLNSSDSPLRGNILLGKISINELSCWRTGRCSEWRWSKLSPMTLLGPTQHSYQEYNTLDSKPSVSPTWAERCWRDWRNPDKLRDTVLRSTYNLEQESRYLSRRGRTFYQEDLVCDHRSDCLTLQSRKTWEKVSAVSSISSMMLLEQ